MRTILLLIGFCPSFCLLVATSWSQEEPAAPTAPAAEKTAAEPLFIPAETLFSVGQKFSSQITYTQQIETKTLVDHEDGWRQQEPLEGIVSSANEILAIDEHKQPSHERFTIKEFSGLAGEDRKAITLAVGAVVEIESKSSGDMTCTVDGKAASGPILELFRAISLVPARTYRGRPLPTMAEIYGLDTPRTPKETWNLAMGKFALRQVCQEGGMDCNADKSSGTVSFRRSCTVEDIPCADIAAEMKISLKSYPIPKDYKMQRGTGEITIRTKQPLDPLLAAPSQEEHLILEVTATGDVKDPESKKKLPAEIHYRVTTNLEATRKPTK